MLVHGPVMLWKLGFELLSKLDSSTTWWNYRENLSLPVLLESLSKIFDAFCDKSRWKSVDLWKDFVSLMGSFPPKMTDARCPQGRPFPSRWALPPLPLSPGICDAMEFAKICKWLCSGSSVKYPATMSSTSIASPVWSSKLEVNMVERIQGWKQLHSWLIEGLGC